MYESADEFEETYGVAFRDALQWVKSKYDWLN
jgi:hypothetical protein